MFKKNNVVGLFVCSFLLWTATEQLCILTTTQLQAEVFLSPLLICIPSVHPVYSGLGEEEMNV